MTGAFAFGAFRLVPAQRELFAHGVPLTLGQRAFDVLQVLVTRHGDLVTKDELMSTVWPGVVVEENNLQVQISALRKVLEAAGGGQRYLVTVAGRGYRFVAPVEHESEAKGGAPRRPGVDDRATRTRVPGRTDNLPQQLTCLIGRDEDLADVKARLAAHRLVTLTGPGGVGKTRLAIEAGNAVLDRFPDGVWLAELAPLKDPQLVATTIAAALDIGLAVPEAVLGTLAATIGNKHLLLIVDNCEHLIGEVARLTEGLLRRCARLSILAASRERLAIEGESVVRVPSLPVPQADAASAEAIRDWPAVRLFTERASALGETLRLTDGNAAAVASICRRLDGIPLALELAVPRLRIMSVEALERGLDDRFRLLTGGSRTALSRQQTLHALIDWSYELLTEGEKQLLARLAAFVGNTTLASVVAVAADPEVTPAALADLLLSLVEKSLVQVDAGAHPRYRLLESTRLFAREKLGAAPDLQRRHAEHFVERLAAATAAWETMPSEAWQELYGDDVDNLRGALEWAFADGGDPAVGIDLVGAGHVLWAELGLMLEHRHWVAEALAHATKKTPAAATARLLSWQAGDVREIDDPADAAEALRAAGLYRKLGDAFQEGRVLLRAGTTRLSPDDVEEGEALFCQAEALVRPFGVTKTLARCLAARATARLFAGDPAQARELQEQAIGVYRQVGERLDGR